MTTNTKCRAKNPANCWKHGSALTPLTKESAHSRADAAIQSWDDAPDGFESRKEVFNALDSLSYFEEPSDSPKVVALRERAGVPEVKYQVRSANMALSKVVLDFDREYSKEHGLAFTPEKAKIVSDRFGYSTTQYFQMLSANPEFTYAQEQVRAQESADTEEGKLAGGQRGRSELQEVALRRLYGIGDFSPVPAEEKVTVDDAKRMFDRWEEQYESGKSFSTAARHARINTANRKAFPHVERGYQEPKS